MYTTNLEIFIQQSGSRYLCSLVTDLCVWKYMRSPTVRAGVEPVMYKPSLRRDGGNWCPGATLYQTVSILNGDWSHCPNYFLIIHDDPYTTGSFFFQNVISFFNVVLYDCLFLYKLVQYSGYLCSTVDTDGLVLKHQGISIHSAEYTLMHFQLFIGQHDEV